MNGDPEDQLRMRNSHDQAINDGRRAEGSPSSSSSDNHDVGGVAIVVDCDVEAEVRDGGEEEPPSTTVEPLCAMVCTDSRPEDGQYPSDHYALLAVFRLVYHPAAGRCPGLSPPSSPPPEVDAEARHQDDVSQSPN
jgi:hypothetical protein